MTLGYFYMVLSLTCFGSIGIIVKLADTRDCRPSTVYTFAYAWSLLFGVLFVILFRGASFHVPSAVYEIALPFGAASAIGGIVFMAGVHYGKISTSWLIINLSAAIPAIGSVFIYHEPVSPRKLAILVLAGISVLLLWKDKKVEDAMRSHEHPKSGESA